MASVTTGPLIFQDPDGEICIAEILQPNVGKYIIHGSDWGLELFIPSLKQKTASWPFKIGQTEAGSSPFATVPGGKK